MNAPWLQGYMQLAFRIDRAIRAFTDSRFVDYYYGPPEWKAQVEAEPERTSIELVREAVALTESLAAQGFEARRAAYLEKQVIALETVCRKLDGEIFSLEDEARRCFDIRVAWIPERQFEHGLALLEEAMPGDGSLLDRYQARKRRYQLAPEKASLLLTFLRHAADEARRRAAALISLPADEGFELEAVSDKPYQGENWYLGGYRSRIERSVDLPADLDGLLDFMCHEGYPGHHTEFVLKERSLYHERGYLEQAIFPIISPQAVISEGIASSAREMTMSVEEAERWLAEHIYLEAGVEPDAVDVAKLRAAEEYLDYPVGGNAAFLLREGRSDDEVARYLTRYSLTSEDEARKFLEYLKTPFQEAYIFTYFAGKRLMKPWLNGLDRVVAFRRFLTEQVIPSELARERA